MFLVCFRTAKHIYSHSFKRTHRYSRFECLYELETDNQTTRKLSFYLQFHRLLNKLSLVVKFGKF